MAEWLQNSSSFHTTSLSPCPLQLLPDLVRCSGPLLPVQGLRDHADDPAFLKKWQEVKLLAKQKAARKIEALTGVQCTELWAPTAFSEHPVAWCGALPFQG